MRSKHWILILLIPLSEIKSIFYNSDLKVSWYLFSDNKRFLCNVLEDYSNIIILGVVFYYLSFVKIDCKLKNICIFLFLINALDLIHLGLMDMQYFTLIKLLIAYTLFKIMQEIKDVLSFLDIVVGTFWSYAVFEIIPLIPLFPTILAGGTDFSFRQHLHSS